MARDLRINVDGNSAGGQKALEEVAAASAFAAREADRMAAQFRQAQNDAAKLDRQLAKTAIATRALAREFAKTNDAGLKAQLDAQKKSGGELKKLRQSIIGDTEKAAKEAEKLASSAAREFEKLEQTVVSTGSSIGDLFSLTSPATLAIGIPAATVGVAGAGGALAAGVGAGIAGAGVAGAAMGDPAAFSAAWAGVTSKLQSDFLAATAVFDGPGLDAVHSIGDAISHWDLKGLFASAVGYVKPLVSGAEDMAGYIFDGVKSLTEDAGPAVAVLAQDLPEIGQSIGTALSMIGDNAKGGAEGLHAIDVVLESLIVGFGAVVSGAEAATGAIVDGANAAKDYFDNIPGWIRGVFPPLQLYKELLDHLTPEKATEGTEHFGHALEGVAATGNLAADAAARQSAAYAKLDADMGVTAVNAKNLANGVDQIIGSMLSADHATLSWHESLTGIADSFKANGKSIDENNAKGQKNVESVLAGIEANERLYSSNIASGKGLDFATDAYDKNEKALEKTLATAGLTQTQIDGLVGKYRSVPDTVKTDVQMKGIADAINDLDDVLRRVNGLPPRKTINLNVVVGGQLGLAESLLGAGLLGSAAPKHAPKHNAMGSIRHAANGVIVPASDPGTLVVGEPPTGGELWMPLAGVSQGRAQGLLQAAGSGYGLDVTPRVPAGLFGRQGGSGGAIAVTIGFSGNTDTAMGSAFMKLLRTGDVQIQASQIRS